MNKKNITIDTDFFEEGVGGQLENFAPQNSAKLDGKEVSSRVGQYQIDQLQNGVNRYRYEHMPDNQYSDDYNQNYEQSPALTRKLQASNEFENIISRAMANLFVRCWEELKAVLPQYHYLSQFHKSNQQAQKQEILQDYNNVFNNNTPSQPTSNKNILRNNLLLSQQENRSSEDHKRQIMQRQKRGITLDSLEKIKVNRSNSATKIHAEKDISSSIKPNQQSKETFINQQTQEKSNSRISRKSYRDKFLEYKHTSRSRQPGIQKSQTYTKFSSYVPQTHIQQANSLNRAFTTNRIRNVHSASQIQQSKNDILRNINHLLMDREDIYQGDDYRYYINHRDSSKNIYSFENQSFQNHPGSSYSRPVKAAYNHHQSTEVFTGFSQQDELMRARLIDEIVQKLNYSKLRLEQVQQKQPKNDELQMIRKLSRLQKVILQLKSQTQNKSIPRDDLNRTLQKSQQQELYKKFIQQMALIKAQINAIKTIRQSTPAPTTPQTPNIIVDNSSNHIISQQQKLLSNYQRQFQRLLSEKQKQKVVLIQKQIQPQPIIKNTDTAEKSIFDQLIENGKNSNKKVGWNDGWEVNQESQQVRQQFNANQESTRSISKSRRRNEHLNRQTAFQNYRYTRKQVLQDIGLRGQVQEEQRVWRQAQARRQLDRDRRQIQFKQLTEKVRQVRKEQAQADDFERNKPIRQKYQQQWQKFQKERIDINPDENIFCQLFPCK